MFGLPRVDARLVVGVFFFVIYFLTVAFLLTSPGCVVRRSCLSFVVSSRLHHGAQETFVAQEGLRQEGRQEEVGPAFGQAQCEEGRQEAPFPQAQVQEGR